MVVSRRAPPAIRRAFADIEFTHAELLSRGVEFINAPQREQRHADGTEEWMAFVKDTEGLPLALMAQGGP